jgi:CBS domain-containing protein
MNSRLSTVADVMTRAVVAVGRSATFTEVLETLQQWKVRAVPVLAGDGRVVGVVSETDLLTAREHDPDRVDAYTAGGLMSEPAITVHPDSPLAEAGRAMARGRVKRLPVVDDEGFLIGVVSRGDLLKVHLRTDADLVDQIGAELRAVLGPALAASVGVRAEDGRITLTCGRQDAAVLTQLAAAVRSVPGVVDVMVATTAAV